MTDPPAPDSTPAAENGRELTDEELDPVAGGARPNKPLSPPSPPAGPVPIPYPNIGTKA